MMMVTVRMMMAIMVIMMRLMAAVAVVVVMVLAIPGQRLAPELGLTQLSCQVME